MAFDEWARMVRVGERKPGREAACTLPGLRRSKPRKVTDKNQNFAGLTPELTMARRSSAAKAKAAEAKAKAAEKAAEVKGRMMSFGRRRER